MFSRNKIYFFYKETSEMNQLVLPLLSLAKKHNFEIVSNYREANIIASIGGDNAFLQAIRKTNFRQDCLYVGISTDHLGFYTDFTMSHVEQMIDAFKNEQLEVRRYPVLAASINEEDPIYCLNECSIRSNIIKTFVLEVFIDTLHFETFRGDGMIISTPTGSTAYNKSVQGAIIDPLIPSMQISEIASLNNNEYRTLGNSFVLSAARKLTLEIVQDGNDYPIIGVDNEALSIRHGKKLELSLPGKEIKVLKLKNNSFWDKVRRNFL